VLRSHDHLTGILFLVCPTNGVRADGARVVSTSPKILVVHNMGKMGKILKHFLKILININFFVFECRKKVYPDIESTLNVYKIINSFQ